MDSLVDLLPLLFIGLYYLLSSRRRAQAKQAARKRVEAPQEDLISTEPDAPTPFQSFLNQLEEAMAESVEGTRPVDEAPPTLADATVVPAPPPIQETPLEGLPSSTVGSDFRPVEGSFDSPSAVDHEQHGFGFENPLSEEAFEQRTSAEAGRRRAGPYDPHGLRSTSPPASPSAGWRRRLQHPEAARDAFVLQTIFGTRGGVTGGARARKR